MDGKECVLAGPKVEEYLVLCRNSKHTETEYDAQTPLAPGQAHDLTSPLKDVPEESTQKSLSEGEVELEENCPSVLAEPICTEDTTRAANVSEKADKEPREEILTESSGSQQEDPSQWKWPDWTWNLLPQFSFSIVVDLKFAIVGLICVIIIYKLFFG